MGLVSMHNTFHTLEVTTTISRMPVDDYGDCAVILERRRTSRWI